MPRFGLIQMAVTQSKEKNLERAAFYIRKAKEAGADLVVLPEMFNCPYDSQYFEAFAEPLAGESMGIISTLAKELGIWVVAGTTPESDDGRTFNTSCTFNDSGERVSVHRKVHLFDIDIPGKMHFMESNTFTPGDTLEVFDTPFGRMAVVICYDIRFPELFRILMEKRVDIVVIPAAFNWTTGPMHWELLGRMRAVDNQMFVVMCGPAETSQVFRAYGHSMVVDPWGRMLEGVVDAHGTDGAACSAGKMCLAGEEGLLLVDLPLERLAEVREAMPFLNHRRPELYEVLKKTTGIRGGDYDSNNE